MPPNATAMTRYHVDGECWIWDGYVLNDGYGQVSREPGFSTRAHRYFYQKLVGPIPSGLMLDHLCRRTTCVNPAHLEPVTPGENIRRGKLGLGLGVCRSGWHDLTEPGSIRVKSNGERLCRACHRVYIREYMRGYRLRNRVNS